MPLCLPHQCSQKNYSWTQSASRNDWVHTYPPDTVRASSAEKEEKALLRIMIRITENNGDDPEVSISTGRNYWTSYVRILSQNMGNIFRGFFLFRGLWFAPHFSYTLMRFLCLSALETVLNTAISMWFLAYSYPRAFHVEMWAPKTEQLFTSIRQETLSKQLKCGRWESKPRRKGHGWQHKLTSTGGQPTGSRISLRSSTELVQSYSATQNYSLSLHQHRAWRYLSV